MNDPVSGTNSQALLYEFRDVSRTYGSGDATISAVDHLDLQIERGAYLAITGPSGSGKSTCLNLLGCLDQPTEGQALFEGTDLATSPRDSRSLLRRNRIGFVFQGFNLLGRTSAMENVELPLVYQRVGRRERRRRAIEALERVGLADRLTHSPAELSGGQQQRVAIARAVVTHPSVLLADEPTGNLDSTSSREIMSLVEELHRERGMAVVLVTHESEVAACADRRVEFLDGRIVFDSRSAEGG